MQYPKRFSLVLVSGIFVLCAALWGRQHILKNFPPRLPLTSNPTAPSQRERAGEEQETLLRQAVTVKPKDIGARWRLAGFYQQTGRPDLAARQLETIGHQNPRDERVQLSLARAWLLLQRGEQAERIYRRMIVRHPKLLEIRQGLAAALFQQQHYVEAFDAAQKAVNLAPSNPNSHFLLASSAYAYAMQFPSLTMHQDDLAIARAEFRKLARVWPTNGDIYYRLGRSEAAMGDQNDAVKDLQRALGLSPRPEVYTEAANAYIETDNRPTARKVVEEGLARFPNDALLHNLRGELLQASAAGDADAQALTEFQKAVQIEPENASFQSEVGTAYLRVGNLPAARTAFEMAVRLNPNRGSNYQQLAAIYTRQGDPQRASQAAKTAKDMVFNSQQLKQIQSLLVAHPESIPLHLILADRFRDIKYAEAARDEYLVVLHLDPKNARAKQGLAALTAKVPISPRPPG